MNDELVKNLTALIDETISEIEDLKKSRYSAAEVDMGKMESGMAGHPTNGSMDKAEDEKDKETKRGRQPQEEGDIEEDHAKKAEGTNSEADPGTRGVTPPAEASVPGKSNLHEEAAKAEDKKEDDDEDEDDEAKKAEGTNSEADPGKRGVTPPTEASVPGKSNLHEEAKKSDDQPKEGYHIKKSLEESESLMKSYIDEKVGGLEAKLGEMAEMIGKLSEAPAERKGVPAHAVPLHKSNEEGFEPLSKSAVVDKLMEMKKSDPRSVDSADIITVETGMGLQAIVDKYKLQ